MKQVVAPRLLGAEPPREEAERPGQTRLVVVGQLAQVAGGAEHEQIDGAQALARRDRAIAALAPLGSRFGHLAEFAHFLVSRLN